MIKAYIDNEEVVFDKEFTIKEEMLNTSSVVLNNVFPKKWDDEKDYYSNFYFPKDYSKFRLYQDDKLIFCGVVKNTGNISLNPRYPHYCSLEILDFKTFLSEGEILDFVISGKTIRQAIEMVVDTVKDYGFVVGNIDLTNADEVIGAYNCQEKTAYDVFQYIKDITQSQWATRMIDENTVAIDFYNPETMPKAENIEYTEEYFRNNNINDITFNYSTDDYRNKQIMISDEVYGSIDYKENITADGYSKQFTVSNNIAEIKSILVNGTSQSFATKESEDLGISANFYYEPGKNQFNVSDNDSAPAVGSQIIITYTPLVYGREVVQNNDEINRINNSTGRKGVIARYENRNDTLSSSELNAVGQSYLKYKGKPEVTLTIVTKNKDLFDIGEVSYFEAPLDDLKQEYMIKSKEIRTIQTSGDIFYTYTLSSSFNAENAINYFDNQRNKNSGNISAGNFITRNFDLNFTTQIIFQNLTIESSDIGYDNALNNGLNMALTK